MAIKPSPTIAGKLRKLFSNNKQTIEPAIDDSIPGGSGGGALVVTFTEVPSANVPADVVQKFEDYGIEVDRYYLADITAAQLTGAFSAFNNVWLNYGGGYGLCGGYSYVEEFDFYSVTFGGDTYSFYIIGGNVWRVNPIVY